MMRDDDAHGFGRYRLELRFKGRYLPAVERAVRPVAIDERAARGVEPGEHDLRLGPLEREHRLDLGRDEAAIEAIRIEEAADHVAAEVVIAGDGAPGRAEAFEEGPRLLVFRVRAD